MKKLCIQLEQSINKRFADIVKRLSQEIVEMDDPFSDPVYFVCAALDSEFKFYWLAQMHYKTTVQTQMKQTVIQMIFDEYEQNINMPLDSAPHTQPLLSSFNSVTSSHTTQSANNVDRIKSPMAVDDCIS